MNDWIKWVYTPEKPYPETLDTQVYVRLRNGMEHNSPISVGFWHDNDPEASSWSSSGGCYNIVAYRLANTR